MSHTPPRIAIGSIFQESNEFVAVHTELDLFRNTYVYEGDDLFQLAGTEVEIAGMLAVCKQEEAEVVPLAAASCVPAGSLSDACYGYLKEAVLSPLRDADRVDGVLLSMHGSMTVVSEGDPEGDMLAAVRDLLGPDIPVVVTLDMHAHVTRRMVALATALVAYTHYPHDDAYTTGERGARLLFSTLHGVIKPTMALAKVPILAVGCNGMTFGDGPMAHLERRARELETHDNMLSVSCFAIHPNNDQPDMGSGAVVVTDADPDLAEETARSLATELWTRRHGLLPEVWSIEAAVTRGRAIEGGPILLVDTADCAGGGAPGDSVALLRGLISLNITERTFVMVVDPDAAQTCADAGIGQQVSLKLGYHMDPAWGKPVTVNGNVRLLSDGRFLYTGGIFGGTWGAMGLSAVLQVGAIDILIMSRPTYDWRDEQYRSVGLHAGQAKFIGIKNPMNYRYAYEDVAKASFVLDTPGPTPVDIRRLSYKKRSRPFFPLDDEMDDLEITVVVNHGGLND